MDFQKYQPLPDPRITVFYCRHGDQAQPASPPAALFKKPPVHNVHYMCAQEVTEKHLRSAFADGADGVLLYGCLVRECQTTADNLAVLRKIYGGTMALKRLNLSPLRLREEWAAQEGSTHLQNILTDFCAQLRTLGPISADQTNAQRGKKEREDRA